MGKKIIFIALLLCPILSFAQRLTIGGYGEAALGRNFYSDSPYRYAKPEQYAKDPSHGRADIPHAVIYLGYDFGKGWTMQTEVEFEHTGTGTAYEREYEEAAEWESEIEKGGEVELEQFWIQKSFIPEANLRMGHIIVPVGGLNNAHEPLNFFNVYRPEGEYTILPSTWHDTGISFWGQAGDFRYEAMVVAGLNGMMFNTDRFIHSGAGSPFEFKVANSPGLALRLDNTSVRNLRLSLSGYLGNTLHNGNPNDLKGTNYSTGKPKQYSSVRGTLMVGSFDFAYKGRRLTVRGNADYGHLDDCVTISKIKANRAGNGSPYSRRAVGKEAYAVGVEAGYDILPWFGAKEGQLYLFARGEHYNSYIPAEGQTLAKYTEKTVLSAGINYFPIPQIAVKCEYMHRLFPVGFNTERTINLGIAYMGFFKQ